MAVIRNKTACEEMKEGGSYHFTTAVILKPSLPPFPSPSPSLLSSSHLNPSCLTPRDAVEEEADIEKQMNERTSSSKWGEIT